MASFVKAWGAAALAGIFVVAGCGGGSSSAPASGADSSSESPSAAASATDLAVDVEATVPRGKYSLVQTLIKSKPRNSEVFPKTLKNVWTFYEPTCEESHCAGKIRSNNGLTFDYDWDGSALRVKLLSPPGGPLDCNGGSPTVKYQWHMKVEDMVPAIAPTDAPPDELTGKAHQWVTYSKLQGCRLDNTNPRSGDYTFTITRKG